MNEAAPRKRKAKDATPPGRSARSRKDPPPPKKDRVMVEFLFRSYPTHLFAEGDLKGTMHVALDQDPATGLYSIPLGKTPFTAKPEDLPENWCDGESTWDEFDGSFERTSDGRIDIDPGLSLNYYAYEDREVHASVFPQGCGGDFPIEAHWMNAVDFYSISSSDDLEKWEKEQGGILKFGADAVLSWIEKTGRDEDDSEDEDEEPVYDSSNENFRRAEARYKVKLYTVLSAHRPDENGLPQYQEGQVPDWEALIRVVAARHPEKGPDAESWAQNAVQQYKYFLNLKLDRRLVGKKFSPSKALDEIWHAHLSFVDRYQRDLVCLTEGEGILEHMPVHVRDSYRYYQEAYKEHAMRMADEGIAVDKEFWPTPTRDLFPEEWTGGDDDHLDTGEVGCGGCG